VDGGPSPSCGGRAVNQDRILSSIDISRDSVVGTSTGTLDSLDWNWVTHRGLEQVYVRCDFELED
jgi:hypothetical protein